MGQKTAASYAECLKIHEHLGGKTDGCQEFEATGKMGVNCSICGCHRKFHRIVRVTVTQVVLYTECHKIHNMQGSLFKDGCKEFKSAIWGEDYCFACECHKSFHRSEVMTNDIPPVAAGTALTRGHEVKTESCG